MTFCAIYGNTANFYPTASQYSQSLSQMEFSSSEQLTARTTMKKLQILFCIKQNILKIILFTFFFYLLHLVVYFKRAFNVKKCLQMFKLPPFSILFLAMVLSLCISSLFSSSNSDLMLLSSMSISSAILPFYKKKPKNLV